MSPLFLLSSCFRLAEKGSLGGELGIGFIAAHSFEVPDSHLKLLSYDSLHLVLAHVDLRMQLQDATFKLILHLSSIVANDN
jgi:hypothetical protein